MRSILIRVLFAMALVVFVPVTVEAARARQPVRRVSRYQANRAAALRAAQQRLWAQRQAQVNRARAAQARRAAYARNPGRYYRRPYNRGYGYNRGYRYGYNPATAAYNAGLNAGLSQARMNAAPTVVSKDYEFQMSDPLSVRSLLSGSKEKSFEDLEVGQTVTVTLVREKVLNTSDSTAKTRSPAGQLTGVVVNAEDASVKTLTLRVSAYGYPGQAENQTIPVVPGQFVSMVQIRREAPGVGALFK